MQGGEVEESSHADLKPLLDEGLIPDEVRERAEALIKRLTTPVRVTIIGPRSTGKSTIVNLLLGGNLLDPRFSLPTTQFSFSGDVASFCTAEDGTKSKRLGFDVAKLSAQSSVFVDAKLPLAALKKISVLEVVPGEQDDSLVLALRWASDRSDIVIWCTERFSPVEQKIWATAPDIIKDHAYLLLTKMDTHSNNKVLASALRVLKENFADDFKHILPISGLNAVKSRKRDGTIDKEGLTNSGGQALIGALMHDLELGRQAAIDQAEMILSEYPAPIPKAQA